LKDKTNRFDDGISSKDPNVNQVYNDTMSSYKYIHIDEDDKKKRHAKKNDNMIESKPLRRGLYAVIAVVSLFLLYKGIVSSLPSSKTGYLQQVTAKVNERTNSNVSGQIDHTGFYLDNVKVTLKNFDIYKAEAYIGVRVENIAKPQDDHIKNLSNKALYCADQSYIVIDETVYAGNFFKNSANGTANIELLPGNSTEINVIYTIDEAKTIDYFDFKDISGFSYIVKQSFDNPIIVKFEDNEASYDNSLSKPTADTIITNEI
jgi:hypothetical protein